MAVATNSDSIQFNGGGALSASWPNGDDGAASLPVTHWAFWPKPVGGQILLSTPFSLSPVFQRGKPVQIPAESLRLTVPHTETAGRWRDYAAGSSGELSLAGANRVLEMLVAGGGNTLVDTPTTGQAYLSFHRCETRRSTLGAPLLAGGTSLTLATALPAQTDQFLRINGNAGGTDEIVRVTEVTSVTEFSIARAQPDFVGSDTVESDHNVGNVVTLLEGPDSSNELVAAGVTFPASPVENQSFVFSASADITDDPAIDENGAAVTAASADDFFMHNGTAWVRQSQGQGVLREFGAVGYARVAIARNPLMVAGVATAYTDAESFEANRSGWVLTPQ